MIRRARSRAIVAGLVAVLLLLTAACTNSHRTDGRLSTESVAPTQTSSIGNVATTKTALYGLTLTHPARWRYVPVERVSAGPAGVVGFLTTGPVIKQCLSADGCGPPIASITPGGVLVIVYAMFIGQPQIIQNATVAGVPAQRQAANLSVCTSGTTSAETITISPRRQDSLVLTTCTGSDDASARSELAEMIATAAYV
jgi:hypothetical protein